MYKPTHDMMLPASTFIPSERERPRSLSRSRRVRFWRRWLLWWNEERLAILALSVGNACFLGLVLWWML